VTPNQYGNTINYSKVSKEIKFGNFALDNTFLYLSQQDAILNVPELVTLFIITLITSIVLQTGITLNYFTKYFANDYNPVIGVLYSG
jgi:hypothetical protein